MTKPAGRWRQKITSPRIETLRQELDRRPGAIDEFWESITEAGSPITEEIPGEPDARCVTFVYRDWSGDLDHVALCWFIVLSEFASNLLLRVGKSDLMALSLRLPAGTRTEYLLSPDERLDVDDIEPLRWELDRLNPNTVVVPPNEWRPDIPTRYSLLELPGATPRPWSRPADSEETAPDITLLIDDDGGRARRVWLQHVGDPRTAPERLLVLLDGWDFLFGKRTALALSRLHEAGKIPAAGVVYVDSGTATMRAADHTGSRAYSAYLAEKILPLAHRHFDTALDARATTIGGMSSGGFTALACALHYPKTFGNVLALATPTQLPSAEFPDGLTGAARQLPPDLRPRIHLQAGLLEVDTRSGPQDHILGSNHLLLDDLVTLGFDVALDEEPCGHGRTDYAESLLEGICRLFRR